MVVASTSLQEHGFVSECRDVVGLDCRSAGARDTNKRDIVCEGGEDARKMGSGQGRRKFQALIVFVVVEVEVEVVIGSGVGGKGKQAVTLSTSHGTRERSNCQRTGPDVAKSTSPASA